MERQPVASSNITSIGYDASAMILEVEFHNGRVYQYMNVPQEVHAQMMNAPSKGQFLNYQILPVYPAVRI